MNARAVLFLAVCVALCSAAFACTTADEMSCGQAWRCPYATGQDRCNCVTQYMACLAGHGCATNPALVTEACGSTPSGSSEAVSSSSSSAAVSSSSAAVVSSSSSHASGSSSEAVVSGSSSYVSSGSSSYASSSPVSASSSGSSEEVVVSSSSSYSSSSSSGIVLEGCKDPFTINGIAYQVSAPSTWKDACKNIGETLAGIDYANFVQVAAHVSGETWIASWNTDSYDGVPLVFLPNSVFTTNDGKSRPALCTCHGAAPASSSEVASSSSSPSSSSSSSASAPSCDYVWNNWTACSVPCGEGNSTRTADALPGECPALQETRVCNLGDCQVESEAPQVECAKFTLNGKAVQFIATPTTHGQACVEFGETLVGVNAGDIATVAGIVPTQAWIAHWNGDNYGGKINLAFTNPGAVNVWGDDARFGSLCTDSKVVCKDGEIVVSSSEVVESSSSSSSEVVVSSSHVSSSSEVVVSSSHVSSSSASASSSAPVVSSSSSPVSVSSSSSAPVVSSSASSSSAPVVSGSSSVSQSISRALKKLA